MLRLHKIAGIVIAVIMLLAAGMPSLASESDIHRSSQTTSVNASSGEQDFLASLEKSEQKPADEKEAPVYVTALSFIFKLALVLALAYGTVVVLKKFTNFKTAVGANQGRIRVIENSALGANKSLYLVAVGTKRLLVASTANQISLVAELDPEEVADTEANLPGGDEPKGGFKDQLSMFLGNKTDTTDSARTVAQMLRESNVFLQDKVREVGRFRRAFRDV
ncbi:flagellar biosynthetic protein FliO [bacterium]|nr:flagellar biosynthetic protein FliO [bacterium]